MPRFYTCGYNAAMQPAFRRVALIGKKTPEIAASLRALREFLRGRGCEVMVERETAQSVGDGGARYAAPARGRSRKRPTSKRSLPPPQASRASTGRS